MRVINALVIILISISWIAPAQAADATLQFSVSAASIAVGETAVVIPQVTSTLRPMNAIDVSLVVPTNVDVVSIDMAPSVITLWISPPTFDPVSRTIRARGTTVNGFQGTNGALLTITVRGVANGSGFFTYLPDSRVLAHDGDGTDIAVGLSAGQLLVGNGLKTGDVILYQHANFLGVSVSITEDQPNLATTAVGVRQLSSLQLTGAQAVEMFTGINYTGQSELFTGSDADLRDNVIGNDTVSSIRFVPFPVVVTQPGALLKGTSSAVYFVDANGVRHAFPQENVYKTWYSNFQAVKKISDVELSVIPLGGNVRVRPGVPLVKFQSVNKIYVSDCDGTLHWLSTAGIARAVAGDNWESLIIEVSDAFFSDYAIGLPVMAAEEYHPGLMGQSCSALTQLWLKK